jgi:putative transposase
MMRVQTFPCSHATAAANALNRESGHHYTNALVWHYRIYRRTGHRLSSGAAGRLEDYRGGASTLSTLYAHSRDAAQQGCHDACKVARNQQKLGLDMRYPRGRKLFRTTTWKNTGIRIRDGLMLLARARGCEPSRVPLPANLQGPLASAYPQVELVWDHAGRHYHWQVTLEDGAKPAPAPGSTVVAVDLGEIHPASTTDGREAVVVTSRRLRAARQYTVKRGAEIRAAHDQKRKGSRRWKKLQSRKNRYMAQQKQRTRDIEHKAIRKVVDWAKERQAGTLALGDVRDVADGKRLGAKSQQKIGLWSHGKVRQYITYTAQAEGIAVELVDEHDTSKTCPRCGQQHKPRGRAYRCLVCGFVAHRDVVGSVNILSRNLYRALARIPPPPLLATTYRYPVWITRQGKRLAWVRPCEKPPGFSPCGVSFCRIFTPRTGQIARPGAY